MEPMAGFDIQAFVWHLRLRAGRVIFRATPVVSWVFGFTVSSEGVAFYCRQARGTVTEDCSNPNPTGIPRIPRDHYYIRHLSHVSFKSNNKRKNRLKYSQLCNGKERKCRNKQFTPSRLNRGPLDLKSSTLSNELKRYPSSAVLVVVLINPNHYMEMNMLD